MLANPTVTYHRAALLSDTTLQFHSSSHPPNLQKEWIFNCPPAPQHIPTFLGYMTTLSHLLMPVHTNILLAQCHASYWNCWQVCSFRPFTFVRNWVTFTDTNTAAKLIANPTHTNPCGCSTTSRLQVGVSSYLATTLLDPSSDHQQ